MLHARGVEESEKMPKHVNPICQGTILRDGGKLARQLADNIKK